MFVWATLFSVFKLLLVTAAEEANVAELQVIMWPYTICLISTVYCNKPILIAQIGWYNKIITFNDTHLGIVKYGHQNAIM